MRKLKNLFEFLSRKEEVIMETPKYYDNYIRDEDFDYRRYYPIPIKAAIRMLKNLDRKTIQFDDFDATIVAAEIRWLQKGYPEDYSIRFHLEYEKNGSIEKMCLESWEIWQNRYDPLGSVLNEN